MRLLLVENFSQLPAMTPEIWVPYAIFESPKGQKGVQEKKKKFERKKTVFDFLSSFVDFFA